MPPPSPAGSVIRQKVVVGMADLAVTNNPAVTFTTYSLGSCLGITIYDPVVKVGGMLHLMLPDSSVDPLKVATQPGMFVDTGIPALFRSAYQLKADKYRLVINVAGGAQILDSAGFFNIGKRNHDALIGLLGKHELNIHAKEIGGLVNRTMYLDIATGEVRLKVSGMQKEIQLCKPLTNS